MKKAEPPVYLPMLATLIDKPFDEKGWLYEVKWDGYRTIAYINNGTVALKSRNNKSFNEKFYPVTAAFEAWNVNAVVDGEIIVADSRGAADFSGLQAWRSEADGPLVFYAFDLLWLDGKDISAVPLHKRRKLLASVIPQNNPTIKLSETFDAGGAQFFELADKLGLEGIMAKREDSLYQSGHRSKDWLKIKTEKRQEFVIGGYTLNENSSKLFSALLVGVYDDAGAFHFLTAVGTGFSTKLQKELMELFKPLQVKHCPFVVQPDYNKPSRFRPNPPKASAIWLKPHLVAEVSYRELTKDGAVRHASFKGLRTDKLPREVKMEHAVPTASVASKARAELNKKPVLNPTEDSGRKTLLNPKDETQTRVINKHEIKFGNLSKVYWKDVNVTKRQMLNYYYQVAPLMLPYMKDRPQTLNRFPNGVGGKSFYQKDVKGKAPSWIETFPYFSHADNREKKFLVCTNEASLLYIASLGCIEMNPWSSRTQKPDNPDWCIIDLDPDGNAFEQVIETAQITRQILDAAGIKGYCKTSGSTGLHIYIPLAAKYTYEDSKEFGRVLAKLVHKELPDFTSIERKTADRKGKIYIDFLQNRPQATVATAYSLRPRPGAPVSMPLHWEEVKKGLKITDHNIFNAVERLKERGDIFKPVIGKGIDLQKVLKKIDSVFQ